VFNLMSLACARSGHYRVVTEMFEFSLWFSLLAEEIK
jgi:hypothetical protein